MEFLKLYQSAYPSKSYKTCEFEVKPIWRSISNDKGKIEEEVGKLKEIELSRKSNLLSFFVIKK